MQLEARIPAGLRLIAYSAAGVCVAILVIAFSVFVLAASQEAREFVKAAAIVASGIVVVLAIAWAAGKGMRLT